MQTINATNQFDLKERGIAFLTEIKNNTHLEDVRLGDQLQFSLRGELVPGTFELMLIQEAKRSCGSQPAAIFVVKQI